MFHHGAAGVPAPLTGAAALDICDLRGGGVPMVKVGNEAFVCREKRLENQKNFLASRKVRHDTALEEFQRAVDVLSEECQQEVEGATTRVKKDLEEKVVESNAILEPLEPPPLPERPEGEEPWCWMRPPFWTSCMTCPWMEQLILPKPKPWRQRMPH